MNSFINIFFDFRFFRFFAWNFVLNACGEVDCGSIYFKYILRIACCSNTTVRLFNTEGVTADLNFIR